ncbi:hypothetical protein JHK82_032201 [Glycine max]|uniref:Uncharacterized protein n=2 Tax=Glycine subgen. Soja TaxID=1462606 RepID=A0A0R0HUW5_SOYBN|nr:hypothetical protein JHK87_032138 [Glycine soja]KAG4989891.1 hypothetical protein JHK85_032874 [Glycine max]KAG4995477.1 hypothetical protein JHK86_032304 [Glycine max]KAG5125464.1 hypothetical protein JHK82_032201 [Glycine max]KAG5146900.1 hypothetical protein JHK84_032443 [Glycine max]
MAHKNTTQLDLTNHVISTTQPNQKLTPITMFTQCLVPAHLVFSNSTTPLSFQTSFVLLINHYSLL